MIPDIRLHGAEIVEQIFGSWPTFHDAEILKIELDRSGPALSLDILAFRPDGSTTEVQGITTDVAAHQHYKVRFRFYAVDDFLLEDFNHQNVMWGLTLTKIREARPNSVSDITEERLKVEIEPTFGAHCSFTCSSGEVTSVERSNIRTGLLVD